MSTDLTTTIILLGALNEGGVSSRFIRTADGSLRIVCGDEVTVYAEEDAIMLRDWLNDEWPVHELQDEITSKEERDAFIYGYFKGREE